MQPQGKSPRVLNGVIRSISKGRRESGVASVSFPLAVEQMKVSQSALKCFRLAVRGALRSQVQLLSKIRSYGTLYAAVSLTRS